MSAFGDWLRECRTTRGLGVRELARIMGISATFLSRTEHGQREAPAEDHLLRAADALGVDGDEIIVRSGRIPRDVKAWLLADCSRVAAVRRRMRRGST